MTQDTDRLSSGFTLPYSNEYGSTLTGGVGGALLSPEYTDNHAINKTLGMVSGAAAARYLASLSNKARNEQLQQAMTIIGDKGNSEDKLKKMYLKPGATYGMGLIGGTAAGAVYHKLYGPKIYEEMFNKSLTKNLAIGALAGLLYGHWRNKSKKRELELIMKRTRGDKQASDSSSEKWQISDEVKAYVTSREKVAFTQPMMSYLSKVRPLHLGALGALYGGYTAPEGQELEHAMQMGAAGLLGGVGLKRATTPIRRYEALHKQLAGKAIPPNPSPKQLKMIGKPTKEMADLMGRYGTPELMYSDLIGKALVHSAIGAGVGHAIGGSSTLRKMLPGAPQQPYGYYEL